MKQMRREIAKLLETGQEASARIRVSIKYEDGSPVDAKGIGRRILDRVHKTYAAELNGKRFAYDGENSLFTIGPLPQNKLDFTVVLDEVSSNR